MISGEIHREISHTSSLTFTIRTYQLQDTFSQPPYQCIAAKHFSRFVTVQTVRWRLLESSLLLLPRSKGKYHPGSMNPKNEKEIQSPGRLKAALTLLDTPLLPNTPSLFSTRYKGQDSGDQVRSKLKGSRMGCKGRTVGRGVNSTQRKDTKARASLLDMTKPKVALTSYPDCHPLLSKPLSSW